MTVSSTRFPARVILNPLSGGRRPPDYSRLLEILGRRLEIRECIVCDPRQRDATVDGTRSGATMIVVVGGDGTVQRELHRLHRPGQILGLIPAGSANVLARRLRLPLDLERAALVVAAAHRIKELPLAQVESDAGVVVHAASQIGIGIDATMANALGRRRSRRVPRGFKYSSAVAHAAMALRRLPTLTIAARGCEWAGVSALIQIGDAYSYVGSKAIRFATRTTTGFDILVAEDLRARTALRAGTSALRGHPLGSVRGLVLLPGYRRLTVCSEAPFMWHADGELQAAAGRLCITMRSRALVSVAGEPD
jgi:diacylglycerol kinase (ATP)